MGLVRSSDVVIMVINNSRLHVCQGRLPVVHHLINFIERMVNIIVSDGLWGERDAVVCKLSRGESRVRLLQLLIVMAIDDGGGGVSRRNSHRDFL